MTTLYRGIIGHPIVFPESVIITAENLDSIDFDKVIYCEISALGAMGNEGGILMYLMGDKDNLITYETNICIDKESYDATSDRINQKTNLFINYRGGFGNYVYIKKGTQLEIDEKYNCFWYHSQNTKLRVDSSVDGVFLRVVAEMPSMNEPKKKSGEKIINFSATARDKFFKDIMSLDKLSEKESIKSIIESTAKRYDISVYDLLIGPGQNNFFVPRNTAMYLLRKELKLSFVEIARIMRTDHIESIHAYHAMEERLFLIPQMK